MKGNNLRKKLYEEIVKMPQKQLVYSDIEYLRYFNLKADSKKLSKETTYLINSLEGIQEDFKKTLLENKEITPKHEWDNFVLEAISQ